MDRLVSRFEVKSINEQQDSEYYEVEGYASVFGNIDLGNDIVEKGAFSECLAKGHSLSLIWNHNLNEPAIGKIMSAYEDNNGLCVKARMPKGDAFVRDRIMPQLKTGSINSMSFGYMTEDYEMNENTGTRRIKKANIFEVSLVNLPMNPQAKITMIKAAVPYQDLPILNDKEREWDADTAIGRVKEFTASQDEPSQNYKKAFLVYDEENPDKYSAYKLPIADVVNNKLVAIPRGIFAAAAAISGARGGVKLSPEEKQSVVSSLNKYYKKMADMFDDDSIVSLFEKSLTTINDVMASNKYELENLLRDNGFSGKASKYIVKMVKSSIPEKEATTEDDDVFAKELQSLVRDLKKSHA